VPFYGASVGDGPLLGLAVAVLAVAVAVAVVAVRGLVLQEVLNSEVPLRQLFRFLWHYLSHS